MRPTRKIGQDGFRIWLQGPDDTRAIKPCDCGWAPELGTHYRVAAGSLADADAIASEP